MRRNRLTRFTIISFAATGLWLGLAAPPAAAQDRTINPEQACRDDAFRLCNDFIPDRDKVGACLRRKARSLSHDCRTVISGGGGAHGATRHVVRRHYRHHR
jgi:hypothetical protein